MVVLREELLLCFARVCHSVGMTVQPEPIYPDWTLGDRLRKARTIARMTQGEFAAAIGVKEGSLAAWETDRAQPRNIVGVAKRIELLTGIPAAWVLDLNPPRPIIDPHPGVENQPRGSRGGRRTGLRIISAEDDPVSDDTEAAAGGDKDDDGGSAVA